MALLVYKEKGETDAANKLLQKLSTSARSDSPVQRWITAVYKNDASTEKILEKEFGDNIYFTIVKKTSEL